MANSSAFFLLAVFICGCGNALSQSVNLPGVDVLSSGFDGAALTTKFQIFDFASTPGPTVHVGANGKNYVAPAMVNVVTDGPNSKKVDASCESVAESFSDYLSTYTRSTHFSAGAEWFYYGNWKLTLDYHKDVQDVYHAITSKGQSIGVSESWWGMYEMSAPPAFLLNSKLHPFFAQSKAYLKTIGTPKTEADQLIYNQVCCGPSGFGTHYVGSLIVGGRATVQSFINNSFHSEYSKHVVDTQVSFGFEYTKLHLSLDKDAKSVHEKMMHQYLNNSNAKTTFQPDSTAIDSDPAPWLAWERVAAENPTVVNTSVSSLANLFFESPEVMTHMQKTIDFYLKNGKAPTLAQANGASGGILEAEAELESHPNPLVPGLQIVGCGFDAPSLSSKTCLFETSPDDIMEWSNPYYPDIKYSVPLGFYAMDTPESLAINGTIEINTVDDYIQHTMWTEEHHSSGLFGFGSKTESTTVATYYRHFYAQTYSLALSLMQIAWFTLTLMEFPLPKFSSAFQMSLDYLPKTYDPNNKETVAIYDMFFESFGTSVVTKADMGGLVWAETWYEACLERAFTDTCINHEVHRGWIFVHKDTSEHECDVRLTHDFNKTSEWHMELLGGTTKVDQAHWPDWAKTVKYDPRPVKMTVVPIYYFLPDGHPTKNVLIDATNAYLQRHEQDKKSKIDAMEAVRPAPPPLCDKYKPKGEQPLATADLELKDDPRSALCPIVGYHGAYCPPGGGVESEMFRSEVPQGFGPIGLPKGVGMTIDVSNGELKLPAWNYDFNGATSTYTDPLSKETFLLPKGMSLNAQVSNENVAKTNVFKSARDLANVWETGYKDGNWYGGEFGHSQSVLDLYNKFFSKQQSSAINQLPHALYRLTLEPNWEKNLNFYALYALKSLPEEYNQNIYDRFMDTWGTHVAKDTLVGGMAEQQVIMKNCVWENPHLTGGLTPEQLEKYLTMDLEKSPTQDSYYTDRRHLSIDHRIGGNPELTDINAWRNSIAKDPALVKIYSHVAWDLVAKNSGAGISEVVIANIRQAINHRMFLSESARTVQTQEADQEEIKDLLGPRPITAVMAHGRKGSTAPHMDGPQYLKMADYALCPAGKAFGSHCDTGVNIASLNSQGRSAPLRYERNEKGEYRAIGCVDFDSCGGCGEHAGQFIKSGCSLLPKADGTVWPIGDAVPDNTDAAMICTDCHIMNPSFPQDSRIRCECPGYSQVQRLAMTNQRSTQVMTKDNKDEKKQKSNEDCNGTVQPNGLPNLKQCNPEWKCHPYAGHPGLSSCSTSFCSKGRPLSNVICSSGCGITTSTALLNYFGLTEIKPQHVADFLVYFGFRDDLAFEKATCNGITHEAICYIANTHGLNCAMSIHNNESDLDYWLQEAPVIAHLRPQPNRTCKFTTFGHYVIIVNKIPDSGSAEKSYVVSDPNSCEEYRTHATLTELWQDCKVIGLIQFSKGSGQPTTFNLPSNVTLEEQT